MRQRVRVLSDDPLKGDGKKKTRQSLNLTKCCEGWSRSFLLFL